MSQRASIGLMSAACIAACAGMASSARAINIAPPSVYLWTSHNYGAGVGNVPGALPVPTVGGSATWTWGASSMDSQPIIDSSGRIYFKGNFVPTPQIFGVTTTSNDNGIFTATNPNDVALSQQWATGQTDPTTGAFLISNGGTIGGIGGSPTLRVSGTAMALGVRVGSPAGSGGPTILEANSGTGSTALLANNTLLYTGTHLATTNTARTGGLFSTLPSTNDWTAAATNTGSGNAVAAWNSAGQFFDMNSSGTMVMGVSLATVGANPATPATSASATVAATTGNASFLGTFSSLGNFNVIARAGDLPFGAGGPQFVGGSNGVGGFFNKLNANGQTAYDASFLAVGITGQPGPGGVTALNNSTAWIHTPGVGNRDTRNTQVYQEGNLVPTFVDPISGTNSSNGSATWTGGISAQTRSFSNAGLVYTGTTTGGDTVTTAGIANSQVLMISTVAGGATPTFIQRQNDIAPGFSAGSNVRVGVIGTGGLSINNSGMIAYPGFMQGSGVTASVQPSYGGFPPSSLISPGTFGNDAAIFAGMPGITGPTGLRAIVRKGDLAPGMGGLTFDIQPSSTSCWLNNAGDVLIKASVADKSVGQQYGAFSTTLTNLNEFDALFGYSASLGTVTNLLWVGQQVEVESGVFKYITQFGVNNQDDGNGSTMGFNDNGQFVAWLRLSDTPGGTATSTSYVVLNVPAPSAGALALVGLGAMARRRRR